MNIQALNFKQKSLDSFVKSTVPRVTKEAEVSLDHICSRVWFLFTKITNLSTKFKGCTYRVKRGNLEHFLTPINNSTACTPMDHWIYMKVTVHLK